MSPSDFQGAALLSALFVINSIIAIVLIAVLNDPPWTDSLLPRWVVYAYLIVSVSSALYFGFKAARLH